MQLPPVGTPLLTGIKDYSASIPPLKLKGFSHTFLQSGTAALALALTTIVRNSSNPNRNVVIPGYACPDLVSACEFAGTHAVIVDFDSGTYQYDLNQIEKLNGTLLAVISPSLLGISMPVNSLREAISSDVLVIEDNAQWFPEHELASKQKENMRHLDSYDLPRNTQQSDFFITSFGRGKPVNLMGGGLLAWHEKFDGWFEKDDWSNSPSIHSTMSIRTRAKSHLFNWVCHPIPYGLLSRIPPLKLGATEYHELKDIVKMESEKESLSHHAIYQYLSQPQTITELLKKNLPYAWPEQAANKRLLRLPFLASNKHIRDAIVNQCNARGLGASVMYEKPLIAIKGIRNKVSNPFSTPIAEKVADGFFTLPLHPRVAFKHVEEMIDIMTPYFNDLKKVPT